MIDISVKVGDFAKTLHLEGFTAGLAVGAVLLVVILACSTVRR